MQTELRQLARDAEREDVEATITSTQNSEDRMELVREELVQKVHRKAVRAEVAEAQQWKQMFFKGISKNKVRRFARHDGRRVGEFGDVCS